MNSDSIGDFIGEWRTMMSANKDSNREVDPSSTFRFGFGVEGGHPYLFVGSPTPLSAPRLSDAVKAESRRRQDGLAILVLKLVDLSLKEVFFYLGLQLANLAVQANSVTDLRAAMEVTLRKWRQLLEGGGWLSNEALRGLVAELWVLWDKVLPECQSGLEAIESWEGPKSRPKDFMGSDWAREVKAVSPQGESVEVHGAEQLAPIPAGDLHLDVITTSISDAGVTLPQAVSWITAELDELAAHEFVRKVEGVAPGYDRPEYESRFVRILRHRTYKVDEDFPRIIPRLVPAEISHVNYTLKLTTLVASEDRPLPNGSPWIH